MTPEDMWREIQRQKRILDSIQEWADDLEIRFGSGDMFSGIRYSQHAIRRLVRGKEVFR